MNRKMLWASALTLTFASFSPVLAQPAAGPSGTASVPAEKLAPQTPATEPAGTPAAGAGMGMSSAMPMKPVSAMDKRFVEKAAEGGMMEVQAGKIAQDKATDPKVKAFGDKMVTEHTANNDKLASLAGQKNITLPSELDKKDQAELDKMQKLDGAKFDKAYLKAQVSGHEKMLKLMQAEAKTGKDADLKAFATTTETAVQEHLDMAKQAGSM